jgi:hypothetical protein
MGDKGKGKAEDLLIQKAVKEEKKKLKKRKAEPEHKRPLAVGAHQVVGQGPGEFLSSLLLISESFFSTRNLLTLTSRFRLRRSKKTRPKPSNQALPLQFPVTITTASTPSPITFHSPNRPGLQPGPLPDTTRHSFFHPRRPSPCLFSLLLSLLRPLTPNPRHLTSRRRFLQIQTHKPSLHHNLFLILRTLFPSLQRRRFCIPP